MRFFSFGKKSKNELSSLFLFFKYERTSECCKSHLSDTFGLNLFFLLNLVYSDLELPIIFFFWFFFHLLFLLVQRQSFFFDVQYVCICVILCCCIWYWVLSLMCERKFFFICARKIFCFYITFSLLSISFFFLFL